MRQYKIIGLDLAKTKFHFVGLNNDGEKVLSQQVHRDHLRTYITKTFPKDTLIVMEACSSCHYWGRQFEALGFQVKRSPKMSKAMQNRSRKMTLMML